MHYRLFYALYLYENKSVSSTGDLQMVMSESKKGQQSLMRYRYTIDKNVPEGKGFLYNVGSQ